MWEPVEEGRGRPESTKEPGSGPSGQVLTGVGVGEDLVLAAW